MAMQKNIAKRSEILSCTYQLVSEAGYNKVFLRDIAENANINKSLLQHYFPRKSDIINNILYDMLNLSFRYIEQMVPLGESVHLRLSTYTGLFWGTAIKHDNLNRFVVNIISERELLEIWIDIVYKWLHSLKDSSIDIISDDNLKTALAFSIAGGMELYLHHDEMNIEVSLICEYITTAFMKILSISDEEIQKTLKDTKSILKQLDMEHFYNYCSEQIEWFTS